MKWPRIDLLDLLEIEHPILQAPMGGESTSAMAIAVCESGGLGGLGCSFMSGNEIRNNVKIIRSATDKPFNLNFFAHPIPGSDQTVIDETRKLVADFYAELNIPEVPQSVSAPCDTFTTERLELMLELKPVVISFHFGLPAIEQVRKLQQVGCKIICSATTVAEARQLAEAKVDAIIAQGWEAGGHRGTFTLSHEDFGIGTLALVPQIVDAVDVPVIATGGIADGRGIAAAFALGASGVQLGSAFLFCPEANIDTAYRNALNVARDDDTRLTKAFSGRPARAKNNRYIEQMASKRVALPNFPTMYSFSDPLKLAEKAEENGDFQFVLYGQAAALNEELSTSELMAKLISESQQILDNSLESG